ncbi:hypothetical protein PAXINDRAFT_88722, partial [Paxillus involutus ATCC 200175]
ETCAVAEATESGHAHMLRYYKDADESHINKAAMQFYRVLDHCPIDHPARSAALSNLAMAKFISSQATGAHLDLDMAIFLFQDACDLRPRDHPDHPSTLLKLAITLLRRFKQCKQRDNPQLLDEVISQHRDALSFYVPGQPQWIQWKCNLAVALYWRFGRQGQKQDLGEVICAYRDVLVWTARRRTEHSMPLNNIANVLLARFQQSGDRKDLEEAIQHNRDALVLRPPGHPDRGVSLNNLANMLWTRFSKSGDRKDLEEAIQHNRDALVLRPPGHPDRGVSLNNLANMLWTRFQQGGDREDLEEAIQYYQHALVLTPPGHRNHGVLLNNFANMLWTRFQQGGDRKDLEEAIQHYQDVLVLVPLGHPHRASPLNNIANALLIRFEQGGDGKDLEEAIQHYQDALVLRPHGHPRRGMSLNGIANALWTQFKQGGVRKDLEEATQYYRDALILTPPGHPLRASSLNNIANVLLTQFEQGGDRKDLEEAIQHYQDALMLTPPGHPLHASSLNNIANVLWTRFQQGGDRQDLEEAIQYYRNTLILTPPGHPHCGMSLNNIASVLVTRFQQDGDRKDLEEAIQHHQDALALRPPGHPDRGMSLNNIAIVLRARFHQGGDRNDLEKAIQHNREALVLTPPGHPHRGMSLYNLATVLVMQFEKGGDRKDLEEAIQHHQDALILRPPGHPDRGMLLNNIATALLTRFEQGGDRKDLEQALQLCHIAKAESPPSHPIQVHLLGNFALIHLSLYHTQHEQNHLHSAMSYFSAATTLSSSNRLPCLNNCMSWIQHAEHHQHSSALDAYTRSLELLDSYLSATASVSARHQARLNFPANLSVDAASCALRCGDICQALELLEQGRTILWNQMARFRTQLERLDVEDPHAEFLIQRFQHLSFMLNQQPANRLSTQNCSKLSAEAEAQLHRDLIQEWNMVVTQIRTLKGFSRFLLPPLFSDLQEASCDGPVIVLIASTFSCDAVIVLHKQPPVHICLKTTLDTLTPLTNQFRKEIFNLKEEYPRFTGNYQQKESLQTEFIRQHSEILMELEALYLPSEREIPNVGVQKNSRIWWCPTSVFTALPLHAAGQYRSGQKNLEHFYISSYTPSLSTLIKARQMRDTSSSVGVQFATIVQAKPAGHQTALSYPDQEANMIEHLLRPPCPAVFTKLTSAMSTTDVALDALQKDQWIHFSCHGSQDFAEPFKSSLQILDGPLSLLDIVNLELSNYEFVYLSACQTAVGDSKTLDEMIHLAAGLQFSGVKSVIGTQWSVYDGVAYLLASEFYKEFCVDGVMDCTRAAKALHQALQSLKKQKIPLRERIMFVHIGI